MGWNTAFDDEIIKANMVFPTATAWTQFAKHIHKNVDGTMVVMLPKTTAMIVIFHIMTNSKLEYLQGMMMMIKKMIMIMMMIKMMMMLMMIVIMIFIMVMIMMMMIMINDNENGNDDDNDNDTDNDDDDNANDNDDE